MNGIGPILKKYRLAKELTISDVEEATKIRGKYLEAIEEENFDVLPGKVYLKGFVRSYIKFLDIGSLPEVVAITQQDSAQEVNEEEVKEEEQIIVKPSAEQMVDRSSIKRGPLVFGLGILAIALLFGMQSCSKGQEDNEGKLPEVPPVVEEQPSEPPITEEPVVPEVPSVDESETPVEQNGLNLVVNIIDAEAGKNDSCWMKISADGKVVYEGTLSEGASQSFQANESFYVTFGNAGAVQLTLNNQDLGVAGSIGKVVKTEINAETLNQLQQ